MSDTLDIVTSERRTKSRSWMFYWQLRDIYYNTYNTLVNKVEPISSLRTKIRQMWKHFPNVLPLIGFLELLRLDDIGKVL